MTANSTLDREFLEIRALILQLAAALDRMDRCPKSKRDDPRRQRLESAIALLQIDEQSRAEQIQLHFGNAYDADWRKTLDVSKPN
jgi:hypothetical protein